VRAKNDALAKLRDMPAKDAATRTAKSDRLDKEEKALADLDAEMEALRDRLAE
jgi:hypothetical protein